MQNLYYISTRPKSNYALCMILDFKRLLLFRSTRSRLYFTYVFQIFSWIMNNYESEFIFTYAWLKRILITLLIAVQCCFFLYAWIPDSNNVSIIIIRKSYCLLSTERKCCFTKINSYLHRSNQKYCKLLQVINSKWLQKQKIGIFVRCHG